LLDLGLDTATHQGRFVVTIMAAMAEMERGMISARQRDVHQDRRDAGKVWGVDLGPKPVVEEEIRQLILTQRTKGISFNKIAETLNAQKAPTANGGARWYSATVKHVYDNIVRHSNLPAKEK